MLQVVGEAHKDALLSMSGLNRSLHTLVTDLRRVCEEVRSSTQRCLRAIDHASSLLQQSFISHQQACRCALALLSGDQDAEIPHIPLLHIALHMHHELHPDIYMYMYTCIYIYIYMFVCIAEHSVVTKPLLSPTALQDPLPA